MSAPRPLARVLRSDMLYRKLRPDQWDPATHAVYPAAFIDRHPRLSLYVARIATPVSILQAFCHFPFAQALAPGRTPMPEDLFAHGHGVASLPASLLYDLGLAVDPEPNGDEIRSDGHLNVRKGQRDFAIELAEAAVALTYAQIFNS